MKIYIDAIIPFLKILNWINISTEQQKNQKKSLT